MDRLAPDIAEYCRAARSGRFRSAALLPMPSSRTSLAGSLPPVPEQSFSSTCAAHAVAALVAYAENPQSPPRLSAQFLFDQAKRTEFVWVAKNLESIRCGFYPDAEFRILYHRPWEQLNMLLAANGGPRSAASVKFIAQFEEQLRAQTDISRGSLIHRLFDVVRDFGICSEEIRPSASVQRVSLSSIAASPDVPRGVLDDARRHRIPVGLHLFEHPNNVNEIRSVLAGSRNLRPMPVCVAVDVFEGCTDGAFTFPDVAEDGTTSCRSKGLHEVLITGYEDDPSECGGGRFRFRNSWGSGWGDGGFGTMSYAYLEVFCHEAGTVLAYADDRQPEPEAAAFAEGGAGTPKKSGKTVAVWAVNTIVVLLLCSLALFVALRGGDRRTPEEKALDAFRDNDYQAGYTYAMSTDRTNPKLQCYLGMCYDQQEPRSSDMKIAKDDWTAKVWYEKAAMQGDVRAMTYLGQFFETGRGGDMDHELAAEWFRKAAESGYPEGKANLARFMKQTGGAGKPNGKGKPAAQTAE